MNTRVILPGNDTSFDDADDADNTSDDGSNEDDGRHVAGDVGVSVHTGSPHTTTFALSEDWWLDEAYELRTHLPDDDGAGINAGFDPYEVLR